jgi:hypothetical protein
MVGWPFDGAKGIDYFSSEEEQEGLCSFFDNAGQDVGWMPKIS